ncbi:MULTISPECIES: hypothetical protein [Geobacter]|uniref:hypothetical protein n=1 Tax=Geobacter TaxID=28231 RepID=UPI002572E5AE|nr:hypothetical protein [Geobacter sulfurreducens]BEH09083.1 hypothetical protein GSUET_06950 [Geobacter sulfurreducens subsp. ethanolicus]BET56973.1 hypothetical protein GEO60473_00130 [Geobacter sp. 60473]
MADNFLNINNETIKIIGISFPAIAIVGYLGGKLIETVIQRQRDDRQEFRTAYAKFAETFSFYLQQLETGETTLNILIVSEFPKHDLARRDFIRYLQGSRKRKFHRKWLEYEEKYYQVKNLGVLGACVAIAPSTEDLEKAKCSPEMMEKWELDRRKELHRIIHGLLQIAEKQSWL